ncbi:hypothetical protein NL676_030347 [Syzygium grande]|nr:hypothetical protein NL676_030347 [Syzygium grande]
MCILRGRAPFPMHPPAGTTARDTCDRVIPTCAQPGQKWKDARTARPMLGDPVNGRSPTEADRAKSPPCPSRAAPATGVAGRPRDGEGKSGPSDEERERRGCKSLSVQEGHASVACDDDDDCA